MRQLNLVLLGLLMVLHYRLWISDDGFSQVQRLREAITAQRMENAKLLARNEGLAMEVEDLKEGLEVIEGLARRELGMVAKGETFYQLLED
ncbi:MAG: septum formation initiator family protein [Gammaproteobacteria bacterium]|jgi:cell division protein FtsB